MIISIYAPKGKVHYFLKVKIIYFSSQFQRFKSIVLGSVNLGCRVRQKTMAAGECGRDYSSHGE
jgi:hypothetical protein